MRDAAAVMSSGGVMNIASVLFVSVRVWGLPSGGDQFIQLARGRALICAGRACLKS